MNRLTVGDDTYKHLCGCLCRTTCVFCIHLLFWIMWKTDKMPLFLEYLMKVIVNFGLIRRRPTKANLFQWRNYVFMGNWKLLVLWRKKNSKGSAIAFKKKLKPLNRHKSCFVWPNVMELVSKWNFTQGEHIFNVDK